MSEETLEERHVTTIRFKTLEGWAKVMRMAETNGVEWGAGEAMTVTFYGEVAKNLAAEAHRLGWKMQGYTEETWEEA